MSFFNRLYILSFYTKNETEPTLTHTTAFQSTPADYSELFCAWFRTALWLKNVNVTYRWAFSHTLSQNKNIVLKHVDGAVELGTFIWDWQVRISNLSPSVTSEILFDFLWPSRKMTGKCVDQAAITSFNFIVQHSFCHVTLCSRWCWQCR